MASVYASDSWDNHGPYKGAGKPFADLVVGSMSSNGLRCNHLIGQSLINVDGDEAGAETYFIVYRSLTDDPARLLGGRYVDKFRREGGEWRISKRTCVMDWVSPLNVDVDWLKIAVTFKVRFQKMIFLTKRWD